MAANITAGLGRFIAGLEYGDIPTGALGVVRQGFADTVGVMIAGYREPAVTLLIAALQPQSGPSSLLLEDRSVAAPDAAWINGTAAHALDFDDVGMRCHPSAVLVPAILAEAEALGASGREMVAAFVAGYETIGELILREPQQHVVRGWHPTSVFGVIAAAAACAKLRRLDATGSARALALAASQSGGLVANFGSMTKPFHAGRAAQAGVISARLAAAGYTASEDALENRQGLLAAISPQGNVDLATDCSAGSDWTIIRHGLSVKRYPICNCAHRHVDAILELRSEHALVPEDITDIRVVINRRNHVVLKHHAPRTALEAKFSVEFAMAAAIIAGQVSLVQCVDDFVLRPDVQALIQRVSIEVHDEEDAVTGHAPFDWVAVESRRHGRLESRRVTHTKGSHRQPLSRGELFEKFASCLEYGNWPLAPAGLFDRLMGIEALPSAAGLLGRAAPAFARAAQSH